MKKIVLSLLLILLFIQIGLVNVSAQLEPEELTPTQRCDMISERLNASNQFYENNLIRYQESYTNIRASLIDIIEVAALLGVNTQSLERDAGRMAELINDMVQQQEQLAEDFSVATIFVCEDADQESFIRAMENVQFSIERLRISANDLRVFLEIDLRQNLLNLREQI